MLTVGSLFSGIGGLELGLERAGMKTIWQVECDEYARKILRRRFPAARLWSDVRTATAEHLQRVDLMCGGFPCQDISVAGSGDGLAGRRSGLWSEFARLIRELRPRIVLVENVTNLRSNGLGTVLGDLASSGYDAEWDCIPASAVGAPHQRDRLFVVAHAKGKRRGERQSKSDAGQASVFGGPGIANVAAPWLAEPPVGRVADGVPSRVDRLRCLGNAVVPAVAELIGRRILEAAL